MQLSDYSFTLPDERIARFPTQKRSASRLLVLDKKNGGTRHRIFSDLIDLLVPGDLLVLNNTEVLPARLYGRKESGGKIEIVVERILSSDRALVHLSASKRPRLGTSIFIETLPALVEAKQGDLYELRLREHGEWLQILEKYGHVPLPPYLKREDQEIDKIRYQTVYAKVPGAIAAPTAGLHFDELLLSKLQVNRIQFASVTLHVGAGTFKSIRSNDVANHIMHPEWISVDEVACEQINRAKLEGRRVIAVGTTSVRCLESVADRNGFVEPHQGDTRLFIVPGYQFKCVDALITNFHLPQSTLLLLVAAFVGREKLLSAYEEAIQLGYRFYSYGDAMFTS